MNQKTLIKTLFFLCTTAIQLALAQHPFHHFDQFDQASGLTDNVNNMRQDEHGLFWLATGNGLFRFDGIQAVRINYLPADTFPTTAKNIFGLACDSVRHCVWLATEYGIFKYNPASGKSEFLPTTALFQQKDIYKPSAHNVYADRQGDVWSNYGVYGLTHILEGGEKAETFFLPVDGNKNGVAIDWRLANNPMVVRQDANRDEIIWVGNRRGLLKLNKASRKLERFIYYPTNMAMFDHANAMPSLYPHPNGKVYIGTWNAGMLVFDPERESFTQLFPTQDGWSPTTDKNFIGSILPDGKGSLWVSGSFGLVHFDVPSNRFSTPDPNRYLHFLDKEGNYWQYYEGLRLYYRQKNKTPYLQGPPIGTCRQLIADFPYDAEAKRLYYRTHCQGGVYSLDVSDLSTRFHPLPGRQGQEVEFKGYAATPVGFLVSDEKYRLYLKPKGSDQFVLLPVNFPSACGNLTILSRPDGHIFIAGHEGYFFWFLPGSWVPKVFTAANVGEPEQGFFTCNTVSNVDDKGRVWMRTCGGFSIFVPEEERFIHVNKKAAGVTHLKDYYSFILDEKKRMWAFGNDGFGWLDPQRPEAGIQQAISLPFSKPSPLFLDWGKIWLTSDDGLVVFDPDTRTSRLFDHIRERQVLNLLDGRIMCFQDAKFRIEHLDSLRQNDEIPRPYACSFKVFDKYQGLPGSPFSPAELRLSPAENFFTIGFSALSLFDPKKIRFAYQLEGVDPNWVHAEPGQFTASYTNVAGGNYVFRIKTTNSRGEWQGQAYSLKIHVGTPWYKTWLALCCYLMLIAGGIYWVYLTRKRQWETSTDLRIKSAEAQRLAELDAFKTRFFTNITHEFRTPLSVILGNAELGKTELEKMAVDRSKPTIAQRLGVHFDTISRNGNQLLQLINQLLDLARLESGKLLLNVQQSDVMAFVKVNVEAYQSLAISKKQNLACLTEPAELLMDFDPQRLQQVLGNLVSNALKFTSEFGSVKVVAKVAAGGGSLSIEVEDTGPGISAEDLPRVFDRFYQVESAQNAAGTGIGLALANELAQHMGGSISVDSEVGIGSRFILVLPVRNVADIVDKQLVEMPYAVIPEEETSAEAPHELPLLLHVEDHPDLLRYLQNLLGGSYHIVTARNGKEGYEKAIELVPDIILSDVMMPDMNGFELCEKLKTDLLTSHIPIVLLTAKATVQDKIEGLQQGADAYLMKPFQKEELFATLKNLLENRRKLVAYLAQTAPTKETPGPAAKEHEFLQKIRDIIDKNLSDETFDMKRLSLDLAMSRMQIHRKLTALTGKPTSSFVRSHRLHRAKAMLESSNQTISEIAYATGFSDHTYFTKCFREEFGKTPSKMRK